MSQMTFILGFVGTGHKLISSESYDLFWKIETGEDFEFFRKFKTTED